MLKASELRIGNLVMFDKELIDLGWINLKDLSNELPITNALYKPIQLTEEWLVKFGFETNNWTDNGHPIYYGWNKSGFLLEGKLPNLSLDGSNNELIIKHVHQLQNLYFSLTGKELTTK